VIIMRFVKALAMATLAWLILFLAVMPFHGTATDILICFVELAFSLPAIVILALLFEFRKGR